MSFSTDQVIWQNINVCNLQNTPVNTAEIAAPAMVNAASCRDAGKRPYLYTNASNNTFWAKSIDASPYVLKERPFRYPYAV